MASKFQSRLVGTIILVAVGVVILPDLLDGEKEHYQETLAAIPIKPNLGVETEVFDILEPVEAQTALPDSPVVQATGSQADEQGSETADTNGAVAVETVVIPDKNTYASSAWIIQLMALKNEENANKLVADLQKRGYQAHSKKENNFTRVIVGPDTSKSKLERQIKELEKITGSKGQLMTFKPLNP